MGGYPKSARAGLAAMVEIMANLAIAHPRVRFRLLGKGHELLSLPAAKDLVDRLAQLYRVGTARATQPVDYEQGTVKVSRDAALPGITKPALPKSR